MVISSIQWMTTKPVSTARATAGSELNRVAGANGAGHCIFPTRLRALRPGAFPRRSVASLPRSSVQAPARPLARGGLVEIFAQQERSAGVAELGQRLGLDLAD